MGVVPREHSTGGKQKLRYRQAEHLLLAKAVCARRTRSDAVPGKTVFRPECLAGAAHLADASQGSHCAPGQSSGPHGLGGARQG